MSLLPLGDPAGADTSLVAGLAMDWFAKLPNGRPSTPEDLLAILLLCTLDVDPDAPEPKVVAAKVQMAKLGFGHKISLTEADRLGLHLLTAWRLDRRSPSAIRRLLKAQHRVDQRALVRGLWQRNLKLWSMLEQARSEMKVRCDELDKELTQHLPDGFALQPHQLEGVVRARDRDYQFIFADDMGLGKLQPDDAPVLTPGGWRPIGELQVGDVIVDPDGGDAVVEGVFPHGVKPQFEVVFSDGTSTECGEEHLWHVTGRDDPEESPGQVLTLRQMLDLGLFERVVKSKEIHEVPRWQIPVTQPVEFHPSEPAFFFPYPLGVQAFADQEIPYQMLRSSVHNRMDLLHGLMDAGGECSKGGCVTFDTRSVSLRDNLLDLVRGLGGIAWYITRKPCEGEVHSSHKVTIELPFNPFTIPLKASRWCRPSMTRQIMAVRPSRESLCRCIKVSSKRSLYLTNDYIVTHNTIETISCALLKGDAAFPMLICSPLSMVGKWRSEVLKWMSRRNIEVHKLTKDDGPKKLLAQTSARGKDLVMVGTWSQLVAHEGEVRQVKPGLFIGDESHYICGWESKRTQAAIRCRSSFGSVLLGTGTLMPNGRHIEAYPQLKMVAPDLFSFLKPSSRGMDGLPRGDRPGFLNRFCGPKKLFLGSDDKGNKRTATQYKGRSNDVQFGELINRVMIRRMKSEVFGTDGLPPKTRYAIAVDITETQRMQLAVARDKVKAQLLKRARDLEAELIADGESDDRIEERVNRILSSEAVTLLSRLRIKLGLLKATWSKQRVRELINEGHKVVVFGWHEEVIRKAAKHYESLGLSVLLGTGSMTGNKRDQVVATAEKGTHDVVVLSSAYREGITLVEYDRLIMLERWWIPGHEMQAEDRIYRIGQTRDVAIEFPVIPNSYDDAVGELQVWKEQGQHQAQGSAQQRAYQWLMSTTENPG